jgi:hypothetical protein
MGAGVGEGLSLLQQRLERHFAALRAERDQRAGEDFPIFALEHGQGEVELELLETAVREAVRQWHLPDAAYLPFVVYAAEVGYDYAGEEYWQTFSARTPGWSELEDRHFIRRVFLRFADRFGGARPTGPWAEQFSIICWPITHAVLPTDLQHQLVRLIFEYRSALTSDLLAEPEALGARLAARTAHCSSRFRYFAQNTGLLGQVAAALLSPENESSPYLSEPTLKRIADSLSTHHQARHWLRDVKSAADRVRTHGFLPPDRSRVLAALESPQRLPPASDPRLTLEMSDQGWVAHVELPDLSVLAARLPELHERLRRERVRLEGSAGGMLARGRLLVSGQKARLGEWPDPSKPLLHLEGGSIDAASRLLADQCVLSPGPAWLFRVRERGLATEVRGKSIHPGQAYVLLVRAGVPTENRPSWMVPTRSATAGVNAFALQPPAVLTEEDGAAIGSLGIGVTADVYVRPAGVIPSAWDGEGSAQWLVGDDVVIAVRSGHAVRNCIVSVDGQPTLVDWPEGAEEIFVGLTSLSIGSHQVKVALFGNAVDAAAAEGDLDILIHPPHARPPGGTLKEGLVLLADPPVPTLDELWDGRATVDLLGPAGAEVAVTVVLEQANGTALADARFKIRTPLDGVAWTKAAAAHLRGSARLQECYDEADLLTMRASHPDLGVAQLRCEREFAPIRWVIRRDRAGPFARLIDNSQPNQVHVHRYSFGDPAVPETVDLAEATTLRWPNGGLLHAKVNDFAASVLLPPLVKDLTDLRQTLRLPSLPHRSLTTEHLLSLVRLAGLWANASCPGDPFALHGRRAVLRALTCRLVSDVGGGRWAQLDERGTRSDRYRFQELCTGVGSSAYEQCIASAISRQLTDWYDLHPTKRALEFAALLSTFEHRTNFARLDERFAEFLLRAASEPGTLSTWSDTELKHYILEVRFSPVFIRAARFTVLAIHLDLDDDDGISSYRGWAWK